MLPATEALSGSVEVPLSKVREPVAAAEGLTPEDMRELLPRAERGVELERSASAQAVEDGNQELKSDREEVEKMEGMLWRAHALATQVAKQLAAAGGAASGREARTVRIAFAARRSSDTARRPRRRAQEAGDGGTPDPLLFAEPDRPRPEQPEPVWTRNGRRPGKRWRRTFGQKKGAAFAVGAAGGDPLVVVEGEVDAIAAAWLYPGAEVWAAGGGAAAVLAPAILNINRRVVIEADPDGPGRKAALTLDTALGGRADISWNSGRDPADVWIDTLLERAAILEFDGGLLRHEADRRAWMLAIGKAASS